MSLDELNLPKNNLFKITCRDRHDSPNYTFTWELTSYGAAILQEKKVRFPFVYVLAVEEIPPNKTHHEDCGCDLCTGYRRVVEEKLFCLHEGVGQIQFHRQGTFKIYATVIWYDSSLLSRHTWTIHKRRIMGHIETYRSRILDGADTPCSLNHVEEDAVCITDSFFAKKPNPTLWWWANLWWENKPRNSCDYKKRLLFVLWLQLITVSLYVFLRGVVMGLSYLFLLLVGFRPSSLSFRPMFHAFSSEFPQICDFENNTCNYAFRDKSGGIRTLKGTIVRLPIVWIAASIILPYLGWDIYHHPKAYLTALAIVAGFVALLLGLIFLSGKIQSRRKSVELYYEQVPIEKPKKPRVPVRVRWLDATGKLCLPFPE